MSFNLTTFYYIGKSLVSQKEKVFKQQYRASIRLILFDVPSTIKVKKADPMTSKYWEYFSRYMYSGASRDELEAKRINSMYPESAKKFKDFVSL